MISGEGRIFTLVRCKDNAEWLAQRKQGVGGSDVAAIMGLSKYKGPYALWAEKRGLSDPEDISGKPAVEWGNRLESVIGEKYADEHPDREVRRVNAICKSIERPWAQASLDFEVKDPDLGWGVLEIKTVGFRSMSDWDNGVPIYYQTQVAHYLSVTGRPFADVAVLKAGQEYEEFRIMRDEGDIKAVNSAVDDFWNRCVVGGEQPDITGMASDARAVFEVSEPSGGEDQEMFDDVPELADWLHAKDEYKAAKDNLDKCAARLKKHIGAASGIETELGKVTWRRSMRSSIDTKALKSDYPDLVDGYAIMRLVDGGLRWTPRKED